MIAYRARKMWAHVQLGFIYVSLSLGTAWLAFWVSAPFPGLWRYLIWSLIFGGLLFFVEVRVERVLQ